MEKFAQKQSQLLAAEIETVREAHHEAFNNKSLLELENAGFAVSSLKVAHYNKNEFNKHLVKLQSNEILGRLEMKERTPVKIYTRSQLPDNCEDLSQIEGGAPAFIVNIGDTSITISCDNPAPSFLDVWISESLRIHEEYVVILNDTEAVLERIRGNVEEVSKGDEKKKSPLAHLFDQNANSSQLDENNIGGTCPSSKWEPINSSLNESQIDAVRFCIHQKHVAAIQGPPGKQ